VFVCGVLLLAEGSECEGEVGGGSAAEGVVRSQGDCEAVCARY